MIRTLLSAFTLFLIPFLGFSQTKVSGNIQKNTIWTKANSPYVLAGTVGVPSAYTLTVESGVEIQRTANYQILINGAVTINGAKKDSITFSSGSSLTAESKPFIEFQKSILDNSSIRFVRFNNESGNAYNIRTGNESPSSQTSPKNSGTLKISRSNLSGGLSDTKGYLAAKSMNIDSCLLNNVTINSFYQNSEKINISNSTITYSFIACENYSPGISITNCNIENTRFKMNYADLSFMSSRVKNSTIVRDPFGGGGTVKIESSIFLNTPFDMPGVTLNMKNTKFIITDKDLNIEEYSNKKYAIVADDIVLQGCEFVGVNNFSCIYNLSYGNYFGAVISNNSFSDFEDYIAINTPANIAINNNSFNSPTGYAIANHSSTDISTAGNYFALKSGQAIDDVIFDSNDDLTYGTVNYVPYSATPVANASISRPRNATKELVDGNVVVRWSKNTEANVINYKVFTGYIDPFTYSNTITVSATDTVLVLSSASITDSIAVTASKVMSSGRGYQQLINESWFSPAVIRTSVLPVKLISFNAVSANNKTLLTWETASEVHNDHFDVEYSIDGISFTKIGAISGASNGSYRNSYSFIHNTPSDGINYYRLKQVDRDGHFEYSTIEKVKLSSKKRIVVYPSPAHENINIVSTVAIVSASLINELGQPIKKINGGNSLRLKVDINSLPKGVYRILIKNQKKETDNISFVKQ